MIGLKEDFTSPRDEYSDGFYISAFFGGREARGESISLHILRKGSMKLLELLYESEI